MKKGWVIGIVLLAMALGIYWISRPDKVDVRLIAVETGRVEKTVANTKAGTVEACQRSKLSLPIGGQIDQLLVKEGDHVKRDQLLVTLWNDDRRARVNEAKAAVDSANREAESQCVTARSDDREARRLERLAQRKLVSEESADLAGARAEASQARCLAMQARGHQMEASLAVAQASLAQTELRAPFEGIVAEVTGKIGEYSTPSPPGVQTPPAIDLITDDCHYLSAPIDEVDASDIKVGMPVRVTLDAFHDRHFEGVVTRIAPYVLDLEKQARTVEVEGKFVSLDDDVVLLAGYSADMEIILEAKDDVLRIPSELILDGEYVMVPGKNSRLEKRPVELGIANWRYSEVVKGLSAGDRIVANIGDKGVVEGAPAKIQREEAASGDD
jgi:HlyD family secretion protein